MRGWVLVAAATALIPGSAVAQAAAPQTFETFLVGVRTEALGRGIRPETLDAALNFAEPIQRVIELDRAQPEFTRTFEQYLAGTVSDTRVARGRQMLEENRELLAQVEKRFGVPGRFVVALWGIESDYGRNMGGFSVIQALATLAYDDRRAAYFRRELFDALRIVDDGHIAPEAMRGSWAGAMGQAQFMPSTFHMAAVDFDGDGRRDIWGTKADVFASSAQYLAKTGWLADQTWGRPVKLPDNFDIALAGLAVTKPIGDWQALGVRRPDGSALPTRQLAASIVLPTAGSKSPAYLVYNNYRTLLRWNNAALFAVAVGTLADRIADG
ncbi:MAG: lytic murein transglycosylase [Alphaproteobacteria bacterium]|nr:lytic murein transglycosylase [Alphaproteobacteria bacterium]